jgi:DNA-binding Lrp family transcriptional regulator
MLEIDEIDRKILRALIRNSRTKLKDIANDCEISSTAVKNRINRLEKNRLILRFVLPLNMASFGYQIPVLIGVNVENNHIQNIISLIKKHTKVAGIDKTFGKYNLCLFVFAKNVNDLERLKLIIRKEKGVKNIEISLWNKYYFNWGNLDLLK